MDLFCKKSVQTKTGETVTQEREGELLMLCISLLESLFPIVGIFSIRLLGSIYAYAFTVLIATIVLTALLASKKNLHTLLEKNAQKDLLLTTFFITVMFLLVFFALHYTSAGNVAVLMFLQLLFSYLYFNVFGNEKMLFLHTLGALFMGFGALILLLPKQFLPNIGDLLALIAASIAPVANIYQRRARKQVGSVTILTYRNLLSTPLLFLIAFFVEQTPALHTIQKAIPYLLFNGLFVYVLSKILWIEALRRISITKMSAMLAFTPVYTLLFAHFMLGESLGIDKITAMGIILSGSFLLTRPTKIPA
jgi:drug/metabolite transporter (DMT)-like permease